MPRASRNRKGTEKRSKRMSQTATITSAGNINAVVLSAEAPVPLTMVHADGPQERGTTQHGVSNNGNIGMPSSGGGEPPSKKAKKNSRRRRRRRRRRGQTSHTSDDDAPQTVATTVVAHGNTEVEKCGVGQHATNGNGDDSGAIARRGRKRRHKRRRQQRRRSSYSPEGAGSVAPSVDAMSSLEARSTGQHSEVPSPAAPSCEFLVDLDVADRLQTAARAHRGLAKDQREAVAALAAAQHRRDELAAILERAQCAAQKERKRAAGDGSGGSLAWEVAATQASQRLVEQDELVAAYQQRVSTLNQVVRETQAHMQAALNAIHHGSVADPVGAAPHQSVKEVDASSGVCDSEEDGEDVGGGKDVVGSDSEVVVPSDCVAGDEPQDDASVGADPPVDADATTAPTDAVATVAPNGVEGSVVHTPQDVGADDDGAGDVGAASAADDIQDVVTAVENVQIVDNTTVQQAVPQHAVLHQVAPTPPRMPPAAMRWHGAHPGGMWPRPHMWARPAVPWGGPHGHMYGVVPPMPLRAPMPGATPYMPMPMPMPPHMRQFPVPSPYGRMAPQFRQSPPHAAVRAAQFRQQQQQQHNPAVQRPDLESSAEF